MTLLIIYLAIAIGVSFLCSVLEAVLLSVSPAFVEAQLQERPRRARVLKSIKDTLDQSISAILILNTFAHTMGAAGVGAQAVRVYGERWESLVAFLLTLAILYFSEIIPKTIGATFWRQLALPSAYIIAALVKLLFPFVWLSGRLTQLFSNNQNAMISREELAALARLGEKDGALATEESLLMENMLGLRETRTGEILTPRTVVTALEASMPLSEALAGLEQTPFTRIPIYEGSIDEVVGIARKQKLYEADRDGGGDKPLRDYASPVFRVSEELPVPLLLDQFIKRRQHMFLVEDEFGQTAGIVTLEDAVETLLGREIMDESDTVEDMQALAKSRYRNRLQQEKAE
ncbi:MAG: hemolysin family protein [Halieaceae bacterium]